jgi:hypothetical protein
LTNSNRRWLIAVGIGAVAALSAPPADAQTGTTAAHSGFHIELSGGPHAGVYDVARPELCANGYVTANDWFASYSDPAAVPTDVTLEIGASPGNDFVTVDFGTLGTSSEYTTMQISPVIDDAGAAASLKATGTMSVRSADGTVSDAGTFSIDVTCDAITRQVGALPTSGPEPSEIPDATQPSPAPDNTTFHVEIGAGPFAGTHDVWTAGATTCTADEDSAEFWSATFDDDNTSPTDIGLFADREEPDLSTFSVSFGPVDSATLYMNGDEEPAVSVDDHSQTATVAVSWQHSQLLSPDGALTDGGPVSISVDCASVGRVPMEPPGGQEPDHG